MNQELQDDELDTHSDNIIFNVFLMLFHVVKNIFS